MTGLSTSTIWRKEQNAEFPKRKKLGQRAVGWLYSEIFGWIESHKKSSKVINEGDI